LWAALKSAEKRRNERVGAPMPKPLRERKTKKSVLRFLCSRSIRKELLQQKTIKKSK
jgi:ribosomal protein L44E